MNNKTEYDFFVSDIKFIVCRPPNIHWHIDNAAEKGYYILAFATSGSAEYIIDTNHCPIEKGNILFFEKGRSHSGKSIPDNPWSYYSIAFDIHSLHSAPTVLSKLPVISLSSHFTEFNETLRKLHHIWTLRPEGYMIKCRSLVMELLFIMIGESASRSLSPSHADTINKVSDFLVENYNNTYSVEALAKIAGISCSYFRKLFKEHMKMTVVQYQNMLKINHACDLLESGVSNISETAVSVGYNDIYYFSRQFKKIKGISPKEYSKKVRKR